VPVATNEAFDEQSINIIAQPLAKDSATNKY
jgi:hypothetical protein